MAERQKLKLLDSAYDVQAGPDLPTDSNYICFKCGSKKHFAKFCPCPRHLQYDNPNSSRTREEGRQ